MKDGERKLLFELASQLPGNAAILNIGVEFGASLACLRAGNPTARIIGLDLDTTKAVSPYGCELVQVDSHEAVKTWAEPLDLIFVDGDHGELGVLLDAGFADFLKVGGHILFQDVYDWDKPGEIHGVCPGVYAAVEKWFRDQYKLEFEELPSVDTTRVFKRVREHEQPRGVAGGRGSNTDFQPGGVTEPKPAVSGSQPAVRRRGQNNGKR